MTDVHQGHTDKSIDADIPLDEQDILPTAPPGKATEHQKKTHNTNKKSRSKKRGPNPMGRYPFIVWMNEYLDYYRLKGKAESTLKNESRMLRNLHKDIQHLKQTGKMSTTDPFKLTESDINELIYYLRNRENKNTGGKMDDNTVCKYVLYLKNLVDYTKNPVMMQMQKRKELPQRVEKGDIETLDEEDALLVWDASKEIDGWRGQIIAFIIPVYLLMGLRASELQKAHFKDIDQRKWRFFIRYPKGGKKKQKTMDIPETLIPYFKRFIAAREAELKKRGVKSAIHLFPSMTQFTVRDKPYCSPFFWSLKREIEEKVGFEFDFQMLRRTSGQMILDADKNNLHVVQKHLRHSSTVVTQKYYAQMRDKAAARVVEEVWSNSPFAGR